jgi:hypothetical protein
MWIRRENAFEAIVAPKIFKKAQELLAQRRCRLSDQDCLDRLSALWQKRGHLSHKIIIGSKTIPDSSTYRARFGSLTAAYREIGFRPRPRYRWPETEAKIRSLVNAAMAEIISKLEKRGGAPEFDDKGRLLTVGRHITVSVGAARGLCEGGGQTRWRVKVDRNATSDWTLIFRMNSSNGAIQDYYMLPTVQLAQTRVKKLRITSRVFSNSTRYESIDDVLEALDRLPGIRL